MHLERREPGARTRRAWWSKRILFACLGDDSSCSMRAAPSSPHGERRKRRLPPGGALDKHDSRSLLELGPTSEAATRARTGFS